MRKFLLSIVHVLYILYAAAMFLLLMLFVLLAVILVSFLKEPKSGNAIYKILSIWSTIWMTLVGLNFKTFGKNQPSSVGVLVSNHQSYLDIPVVVRAIQEPVRILGMMEISKVPLFGFIYRKAVILVDRSSLRSRAESYLRMKQVLASGISVLIFPEGGFNTTKEPVGKFQDGAFRLAIDNAMPIKPMVIVDTVDRFPENIATGSNPGKCRVVFLPEITTSKDMDINELKEEVRQKMIDTILHYKTNNK